jgi:hypothetical protein
MGNAVPRAVVATLIAPIAAAIGAIAVLLKDCTIAIEREETAPKAPDPQ